MASAHVTIEATIRLTNPKVLRALKVAIFSLEQLKVAMSWRPEARRAAKALRYAVKNLTIEVK